MKFLENEIIMISFRINSTDNLRQITNAFSMGINNIDNIRIPNTSVQYIALSCFFWTSAN